MSGAAQPAPIPIYPALTGLRFFAAAAIVAWHSQTGYFLPPNAFHPFLLDGGVQLFFVLSGFVLTVNAPKYRRRADFLVARLARVWPGHMAAILFLFWIFWPYSISLLHGTVLQARLVACVLLVQAWSPVRATYWALNAPSWSISVELAFYVAFPFLLAWLIRRPVGGMVVLLGGALGFILVVATVWPGVDKLWLGYINPVVNAPDFALGIVAALWLRRAGPAGGGFARHSAIQLGALAIAIGGNALFGALATPGVSHILHEASWPAGLADYIQVAGAVPGYTLLIVVLARNSGVVSRALSGRAIVYLGEVSYTLYLFHQIMLRWHSGYPGWHSGWQARVAAWPMGAQYALLMAATLALVCAVHHLIEQPARRRINALWRRRGAAPVDPGAPEAIVTGITQGDPP